MRLNEMIRRFDRVKPNGADSYMVRCPCHDDKQQSLCISERDGKILMNCFAGCRTQDILRAVGLEGKDLFNDSASRGDPRPASVEYAYSADLKKIRFYQQTADGSWQKTFCWKHRNENGEWQSGMGGKTPPLYQQYQLDIVRRRAENASENCHPEQTLASREGSYTDRLPKDSSVGHACPPQNDNCGDLFPTEPLNTVFIVEGEKDVDTVCQKLGLEAVCSPHGGSKGDIKSKWKPEYNPLFEGLDVAIIPDNDEVGRQFASMVAKEILPYAKSVKMIDLTQEWPDLAEKGDVTDVLEHEKPVTGVSIAKSVKCRLEALTKVTPSLPKPPIASLSQGRCPKGGGFPEGGAERTLVFSEAEGARTLSLVGCASSPAPLEKGASASSPDSSAESIWDTPISFDHPTLSPFPIDALPVTIRDFAAGLSESTQTPLDMCASSCLAVLALCVQGKYRIMGKPDWIEPLSLYALCIAKPSERKSAIIKNVAAPVNSYQANYNDRHAQAIQESYNELEILKKKQARYIAAVADLESGKSKPSGKETAEAMRRKLGEVSEQLMTHKIKKSMKLYVDDITPEKLAEVICDNGGRMAMLSSEGGIFDILAGAYSKNVNIDVFLKAWSGDFISVDRIGRSSESVLHPALTILLMVQPSVITGVMDNPRFQGRGLTARFLYCMPKPAVGGRRYRTSAIPEAVKENYHELVTYLLDDEINEARVIRLSEEADRLLEAFSDKLEPMILGEYAEIAGWVGKLAGTILRIAGILCRAEAADRKVHTAIANTLDRDEGLDNLTVDGKTMRNAIAIGEYYLEQACAVFSLMGTDAVTEMAKYALDTIVRKKLDRFKAGDLMRACKRFKTADAAKKSLTRLVEMGYLMEEQPENTGKGRPPAIVYHVNPDCLRDDDSG